MGAGCAVLLSQALSYPTPRHDPDARLPWEEEEAALYTNRWRSKFGDRIRLGLNAPLPIVAARRSACHLSLPRLLLMVRQEDVMHPRLSRPACRPAAALCVLDCCRALDRLGTGK